MTTFKSEVALEQQELEICFPEHYGKAVLLFILLFDNTQKKVET